MHSDVLGEFESARAINNLNSNWQLDVHTQLGLQLGARYVRSTFDGERYSGLSTLYDDDFEASRYTAQGPFIKFRMKADQDTFKDLSLADLRAKARN